MVGTRSGIFFNITNIIAALYQQHRTCPPAWLLEYVSINPHTCDSRTVLNTSGSCLTLHAGSLVARTPTALAPTGPTWLTLPTTPP
jgi:hypothetical protein